MASSLPVEVWQGWIADLRRRPRLGVPVLTLAFVAVLLFKLALSAGGRDATAWAAFRLAALGALALLAMTGSIRRTPLNYPFLGIVAAVGLASVGSVRPQSSLDQLLAWGAYVAVFLVVASTITSLRAARRLVDFLVATGGWLCLAGLYLFWGAGSPMMRWYSTFYWPNPFAGFLLLVLPLELVRLVHARSPRETLTHGTMALMLMVPFVLTFSRGAWVAAAGTLAVGSIVMEPELRRQMILRGLVFALAVGTAVALTTQGQAFRQDAAGVLARAASIADAGEYSFQGRLHLWRGALEIFRRHPLLGTGPGTYGYIYPRYQRDVRFYSRDPHSVYLQAAAETGLVGIAAWGVMLVAAAAMWIRALRRARQREEMSIVAGVGLGLLAFFIHSGVELNWSFPAGPATALALLGVLAWYDASDRDTASVRPQRRAAKLAILLPVIAAAVAVVAGTLAEEAFRVGKGEFDSGRFAEAERTLRRGSIFSPLDPRFPSGIADALRYRGSASPREVRRLVEHTIALDRMNPYYRVQLASVLRFSERTSAEGADEVEAALRAALELDPYHYPEAYRLLIQLFLDRGDSASAAAVFEAAALHYAGDVAGDTVLKLMLWPQVARLYLDWGKFLISHGQFEDGVALYRRVLDSDSAPEAYLALARAYIQAGRPAEADHTLREGVDRFPQHEELWIAWRTLPHRRSVIWQQ